MIVPSLETNESIYYGLQVVHYLDQLNPEAVYQIFNAEYNFLNNFTSFKEALLIGIHYFIILRQNYLKGIFLFYFWLFSVCLFSLICTNQLELINYKPNPLKFLFRLILKILQSSNNQKFLSHLPHHRSVIYICFLILNQPLNDAFMTNLQACIHILIATSKYSHFSFFTKKKFPIPALLQRVIESDLQINTKLKETIKNLIETIDNMRC